MRLVTVGVLAACGRIGFDPVADAPTGSGELVQQQGMTVFAMSTVEVTLPAPSRVGDVLVMCGASYDVNLTGVTGGGGTWTMAVRDGATDNVEIWYAVVTTASSSAVVVDGTGTTRSLWAQVSEWSGLATASTLDSTHVASGTTTASASLAVTTTGSGAELSYACIVDATGTMYGSPAPGTWSALMGLGDGNIAQLEWYELAAGPSAATVSIAQTGAYWDAASATFFTEP